MTQWTLIAVDGTEYRVQQVLSWQIAYGLGVPCDSVQLSCLWSLGQEAVLRGVSRLRAVHEGEIVFFGVLDEWICVWDANGCRLEITGRGLQALLLDNEAESADYGAASLDDVLHHYVSPFGIAVAERGNLPPVQGFSVKSGSSCWQVLHQFVRYYGGVTPRLDASGRLLLSPLSDRVVRRWEDALPVTKLVLRYQRYGVLSQVSVQNRATMERQILRNEALVAQGFSAGRVLTVPRNTERQSMRYSAQFQLEQSRQSLLRVDLLAAGAFLARPGEVVEIARSGFGGNGVYRVLEATVSLSAEGFMTQLVMGDVSIRY